jgi:transposase
MNAGFSGKLEKAESSHDAHMKELHAKIGQQSVELDFLRDASSRLGLGGVKKW